MGQKKARTWGLSCGYHSYASSALAPKHSDQACRKVGVRKTNSSRNLLDPIARYETAASPLQGRDCTVLSTTKRVAQADNVKPQTAFFDCDFRPDLCE